MTLAIIAPKEFAFEYYKQPGCTAVVRGEVVHVAKSQPVNVTFDPTPTMKCYNELPIMD